jgi:rhamnose utilization protein RhaD (predicted bifunctional aldolase and dehydrogenase)
MHNRPWPNDLDIYSAQIGKNNLMVQGPGGNTSFKNDNFMWVKASGTRLSDAIEKEIFACVNMANGEWIKDQKDMRPSIEKDFHLMIPYSYVIHTHSLRAISLAIENDFGSKGPEFPHIAFVPYARPGQDLCRAIRETVDFKVHKAAILQNHGFLSWGNSMNGAYEILENFETETLSFNRTSHPGLPQPELQLNHPQAITPDYAVFLSINSETEILNFTGGDLWKKQMFMIAQEAVRLVNPSLGVRYLSENEVQELQNWESEKYRLAANQ